jgi:Raf kinase inhibitor-like YbhB/YbcL family protein
MRSFWCALLLAMVVAFVPLGGRASSLTVESSAFLDGGPIPTLDSGSIDGCIGRDISPPLRITGVPPSAQSLAIVVFDTDANHGAGYVHWVAYGISPRIVSVPPGFGSRPGEAVGGANDAGTMRYAGPCPPKGDPPHHYQVSVYALALGRAHLRSGLTRAALLHAVAGHTLAVGTLTGTFAR